MESQTISWVGITVALPTVDGGSAPGGWHLRIRYRNIRVTKAVGSKERTIELKKKLTTALELYGLDAFRVLEEEKERTARFHVKTQDLRIFL